MSPKAGVRLIDEEPLEPTFGRVLVSVALLSVLVFLLPFVLLALGTPVALALRALVEVARWLVASF